jgi:hypothetical protein
MVPESLDSSLYYGAFVSIRFQELCLYTRERSSYGDKEETTTFRRRLSRHPDIKLGSSPSPPP